MKNTWFSFQSKHESDSLAFLSDSTTKHIKGKSPLCVKSILSISPNSSLSLQFSQSSSPFLVIFPHAPNFRLLFPYNSDFLSPKIILDDPSSPCINLGHMIFERKNSYR